MFFDMQMLVNILEDGFFAAVAAIGFSTVSRPGKRAYAVCAVIAAVGHSMRTVLMDTSLGGMHIVSATLLASFVTGLLAVFMSRWSHTPAEGCLFPALLPMIPGIYAYKAFAGLARCVLGNDEGRFMDSFYMFGSNALTCGCLLMAMVVGGTIPIFMFGKISFQATRHAK